MRFIPFIHQTRISPVTELCHTKSGLPSPLKSPAPTIFQFVSGSWLGLKNGAEINDVPSMNHTATCPVPSRCHTRSGLPSPLKSPIVTIFHVVSGTALGLKNDPEIIDVPSINHTAIPPLPSFCHTRSVLPSALKSPVPTIFQMGSTCPGLKNAPFINVVPSISQVAI